MHTADFRSAQRRATLGCESLEDRAVPATVALAGGVLTVTGTPGDDRIRIFTDGSAVRVLDGTVQIGAFAPAATFCSAGARPTPSTAAAGSTICSR